MATPAAPPRGVPGAANHATSALAASAAGLAFAFRPLGQGDLPLLHRWLNAPHVVAGYTRMPISLDEVARKYGPTAATQSPAHAYVVLLNEQPIGFVQMYRPSDIGDAAELAARTDAMAIDLLLGEVEYTQRGLGPRVIGATLATLVWPQPGIARCLAGVRPDHTASLRAFRKAGFTPVATVTTRDGHDELLLERARDG